MKIRGQIHKHPTSNSTVSSELDQEAFRWRISCNNLTEITLYTKKVAWNVIIFPRFKGNAVNFCFIFIIFWYDIGKAWTCMMTYQYNTNFRLLRFSLFVKVRWPH